MDWEKNTAADIVMGAAAKLAEDMVHGTVASVRDISRYHIMYKNMSAALSRAATNLQRHLLRKKWVSKDDKKAVRAKISQIRALARTCDKMRDWSAAYAAGAVAELRKLEVNRKLAKIVSRIEIDPAEEDDED